MIQSILAIVTFAILAGYSAYIAKRHGVLESISASTYVLGGQQKYLFLAALWGMGIVNLFLGLEVYGFWATAGIFMTGITTDFREGIDKWLHNIGVITAVTATFVGFMVLYSVWIPLLLFAAGLAYIVLEDKVTNEIWWLELYAMFCAMVGYLIIHG